MRSGSVSLLGIAAVAGLAFLPPGAARAAPASGPSFDCTKASQPDEKAICADPRLATLDRLVNEAYRNFDSAYENDKKEIARALVGDRRACGSDIPCIAAAQANALGTFDLTPPWVNALVDGLLGWKALDVAAQAPAGADQPMPDKVGQCAVTRIAELTTRGGEPLAEAEAGSGSVVTYTNGGVGVSYGFEEGLAASRVGNAVAVCLVSRPRDCPKGDDRGYVYYGVDLSMHATWELPDSQHMCGGA